MSNVFHDNASDDFLHITDETNVKIHELQRHFSHELNEKGDDYPASIRDIITAAVDALHRKKFDVHPTEQLAAGVASRHTC